MPKRAASTKAAPAHVKRDKKGSSEKEEEENPELLAVLNDGDNQGWGAFYNKILEYNLVPDALIRPLIRRLCTQRKDEFYAQSSEAQREYKQNFFRELKSLPLAVKTADANEQHYEVPAEFFELTLGKRLKYSSAYYPHADTTLDEAEEAMLALYAERAQIKNGMSILDLGCGWGSNALYLAEKFPKSQITGLSNSNGQRLHIQAQAKKRGLKNLTIYTGDINEFEFDSSKMTFDRICTVEMFEHMKNYEALFDKIQNWLHKNGLIFIHVFCHKEYPYHFEGDNWMTKYFFSGGTMPSEDLFLHFQDKLTLKDLWRVNGTHYGRTCRDWLNLTDKHKPRVMELFTETYGAKEALRWFCMWRVFYMACEELFNYNKGEEWFVAHYLFGKK